MIFLSGGRAASCFIVPLLAEEIRAPGSRAVLDSRAALGSRAVIYATVAAEGETLVQEILARHRRIARLRMLTAPSLPERKM